MARRKLTISETVEELSILSPTGEVDESLDPHISSDDLLRIYRFMVLTRMCDDRMLRLQRQGRLGTFAPTRGQEATQIGYSYALTKEDWLVPSFRAPGSLFWRGWPIEQILLLYNGYEAGNRVPDGNNDLPISVPVGTQALLAVGIGMGMNIKGEKNAVLTVFGDGTTSEGDVSEAFNFAGVYNAPVVFVCENNQYAISLPRVSQTRAETIAQKALAFGFDGVKVDGNDVLAVIVATRAALEKARNGGGPTPKCWKTSGETLRLTFKKRWSVSRRCAYLNRRRFLILPTPRFRRNCRSKSRSFWSTSS